MLILCIALMIMLLILFSARRARADMISTADVSALNKVEVANEIIKSVPEYSTAMRLFRHKTMNSSQQRMPALSLFPSAYFVTGNTGLKQTSRAAWENKYLDAEELAVIVPISENDLMDSNYDIWGEMKPLILESIGAALDAAVFFGINKPAAWPDDIFKQCQDVSHTVSLAAFPDLADAIGSETGLMRLIESDGFRVSGFVGDSLMEARLRALRDANGQFLYSSMTQAPPNNIWGKPLSIPLNGGFDETKAILIGGDFSQAIMAIRQDITWKIADQAPITDNAGNLLYNLFQQDMVALRGVMRVAYQVANPLTRMNTNNADRWGFAALTA